MGLHHLRVDRVGRAGRLLHLHELELLKPRGIGVHQQEVRPGLAGERVPGKRGLERRGDQEEERVAVEDEVERGPDPGERGVGRSAHSEHRPVVADTEVLAHDELGLAAEDLGLVEEVLGEHVGLEQVPGQGEEARAPVKVRKMTLTTGKPRVAVISSKHSRTAWLASSSLTMSSRGRLRPRLARIQYGTLADAGGILTALR